MLSKTGLTVFLPFCGELFLAISASTRVVRNGVDAIAAAGQVSNKTSARHPPGSFREAGREAFLVVKDSAGCKGQASLPRGVLERVPSAVVVSVGRRC